MVKANLLQLLVSRVSIKLKFLGTFVILTMLLGACGSKNNLSLNGEISVFEELLLKGYFVKVDHDTYLSYHKNKLLYVSTNEKGFSSDKFLLHLIRTDNSFLNLDFSVEDITRELMNPSGEIKYFIRELHTKDFVGLRTGQFKRYDGKTENTWVKQFTFDEASSSDKFYKGELDNQFRIGLLQREFNESLRQDAFFINHNKFGILLAREYMYIVTDKKEQELEPFFMLHLVREDYSFDNYSFVFSEYESPLIRFNPNKSLKVARVPLPALDSIIRIRIGQFTNNGNIWTQEFDVDEVFNNKLLRYSDEFTKSHD